MGSRDGKILLSTEPPTYRGRSGLTGIRIQSKPDWGGQVCRNYHLQIFVDIVLVLSQRAEKVK